MNSPIRANRRDLLRNSLTLFLTAILAFSTLGISDARAEGGEFTLVVVPDTQYYLDYTHQTEDGFPFNARQLFFDQMRFIADRTVPNGGDIAFVTAVGDIWQH